MVMANETRVATAGHLGGQGSDCCDVDEAVEEGLASSDDPTAECRYALTLRVSSRSWADTGDTITVKCQLIRGQILRSIQVNLGTFF